MIMHWTPSVFGTNFIAFSVYIFLLLSPIVQAQKQARIDRQVNMFPQRTEKVSKITHEANSRIYGESQFSPDSAQIAWVSHFASGHDYFPKPQASIDIDDSGNVYVAGSIFNIETDYDYLIAKYDSSGIEQWVATYDGPTHNEDRAIAIVVSDDGNVYLTGLSRNSPSLGSAEFATLKFNSAGQQQWAVHFTASNYERIPTSIAIDDSENVYVTGSSFVIPSYEYTTVKYDSSGTEIWVAYYNNSNNLDDHATAIAIDDSGNVLVTGYSEISTTGNTQISTIKYNTSGNQIWNASYNGSDSFDEANVIVLDDSGNVYVAGRSSFGSSNYTTIKYDSFGAEQWVTHYDGPGASWDNIKDIKVDKSGNVYITGESSQYTNWPENNLDYATIKYSAVGIEQWVARYNGPGDSLDFAVGLTLDNSNNVYVTGYSHGAGTFYDYATIKYNSSGAEKWVKRYNSADSLTDEATAVGIDAAGHIYVTGLSIQTNPSPQYLTIKYDSAGIEQWITTSNTSGESDDYASDLAIDDDGNILVTGASWNTATAYDYATIKYNSTGEQQWVARFNRSGYSYDRPVAIVVDNLGNSYVTGENFSTIKYNSDGIEQWLSTEFYGNASDLAVDISGNVFVTGFEVQANSHSNYVTVKFNSLGISLWVATYDGPGNFSDKANAIAIDDHGNVYVTGYSWTTTLGSSDYITIKYNIDGVELWVARYNGPDNLGDDGIDIAVDQLGNVYVTGASFSNASHRDFVTIKYDSSGVEQWVQHYNGLGNYHDWAKALALDSDGNVYVIGESARSSDFPYNYDYATVKYSAAGIEQWTTRYNGPGNNDDNPRDIVVDASGNIYVAGYSASSDQIPRNDDFALIKYDLFGVEQWVTRYNGPGNGDDKASAMNIDNSGNIYVAGESIYPDRNLKTYTTIKYAQIPTAIITQETSSPGSFSLTQNYPNPFNPVTTISYFLQESGYVTLKIFNLLGQEIETLVRGNFAGGKYTVKWEAMDITTGVYFYRLEVTASGKGSEPVFSRTKKMILLR